MSVINKRDIGLQIISITRRCSFLVSSCFYIYGLYYIYLFILYTYLYIFIFVYIYCYIVILFIYSNFIDAKNKVSYLPNVGLNDPKYTFINPSDHCFGMMLMGGVISFIASVIDCYKEPETLKRTFRFFIVFLLFLFFFFVFLIFSLFFLHHLLNPPFLSTQPLLSLLSPPQLLSPL
jgi:hypothetical protein